MYIVTGAAGFIGSAIVSRLNAEGIKEILLVDEIGTSEKWRNLTKLHFYEYMHKSAFIGELLAGNISDDIQAIIHMGACSSTSENDFDYLNETNTAYTSSLAGYAIEHGIRFIYASSAATYGDGSEGYSDDHKLISKLKPLNRYGYSKQLFDYKASELGFLSEICGLKFFNVYGPNEYHKADMRSVVHKAFLQVNESGSIKLFKSYRKEYKHGQQKRDFVYVKDCQDVIWWLLKNRKVNGIFNLGSGTARTWNDLAQAVFKSMGKKPKIEYIEMPEDLRNQYQYLTEAPMQKIKKAGYKKTFTKLEDGVADYVKGYLMKEDAYL